MDYSIPTANLNYWSPVITQDFLSGSHFIQPKKLMAIDIICFYFGSHSNNYNHDNYNACKTNKRRSLNKCSSHLIEKFNCFIISSRRRYIKILHWILILKICLVKRSLLKTVIIFIFFRSSPLHMPYVFDLISTCLKLKIHQSFSVINFMLKDCRMPVLITCGTRINPVKIIECTSVLQIYYANVARVSILSNY